MGGVARGVQGSGRGEGGGDVGHVVLACSAEIESIAYQRGGYRTAWEEVDTFATSVLVMCSAFSHEISSHARNRSTPLRVGPALKRGVFAGSKNLRDSSSATPTDSREPLASRLGVVVTENEGTDVGSSSPFCGVESSGWVKPPLKTFTNTQLFRRFTKRRTCCQQQN